MAWSKITPSLVLEVESVVLFWIGCLVWLLNVFHRHCMPLSLSLLFAAQAVMSHRQGPRDETGIGDAYRGFSLSGYWTGFFSIHSFHADKRLSVEALQVAKLPNWLSVLGHQWWSQSNLAIFGETNNKSGSVGTSRLSLLRWGRRRDLGVGWSHQRTDSWWINGLKRRM